MSDNVKVAVRVRPFNGREKDRKATCIIKMVKEVQQTVITDPASGNEKKFTFDFSYNSFVPASDPAYASQTTLWKDIGVGVLENAYEGYNCSLFAYGQTGAGKSYSMMGYGEDKGIIPIACERMFDRIDGNTDEDLTITVECSMLEIYMEKIRDLFNPKTGVNLQIRNNPKTGFYVENLTRNAVGSYASIDKLMEAGTKARTVASTNMNATSSRAHTIFQIVLTQSKVEKVDEETEKTVKKVATINLIDLAGSERQSGTGATGGRLKEGAMINLSLSALGNCISALAQNSGGGKQVRVPFRSSALTMLLQNSLGGNAKTIMIAAVSPADINYQETLSTLRYANRAKQIKNKAVVNEDKNERIIRDLKAQIEALQKALQQGGQMPPMAGAGAGDGAGGDMTPGAAASADPRLLEKEREEMRAKFEAEAETERQRIREELESKLREQMEQSKTWEERLKETAARQAERDAELRAMGIVTGEEREAQMERAKTQAHMVNLHEDHMLSEQILHFFPTDSALKIGREDADEPQDVTLEGLNIEKQHAVIAPASAGAGGDGDGDGDGAASSSFQLVPATLGVKVFVNGEAVTDPAGVRLHHMDRVLLGNNHFFKVVVPAEAAGWTPEPDMPAQLDHAFAVLELHKARVQDMARAEAARRQEAEEARAKAEAQIKEYQATMAQERAKAEEDAAARQAEYERKQEELQQLKTQGLQQELKEQEERLKKEKDELAEEMQRQQAELQQRLQEQIEETNKMARRKAREIEERSLLDEQLLKTIPLVAEANAYGEELEQGLEFTVKLMAVPGRKSQAATAAAAVAAASESKMEGGGAGGEEVEEAKVLDTEVFVLVEATDHSVPNRFWDYDKFMDRLYAMREMYQEYLENGRSLKDSPYLTPENDPFFDEPEDALLGRATMFLDSLMHFMANADWLPIINYQGKSAGELYVAMVPHRSPEPPANWEEMGGSDDEDCDDADFVESIEELKGQQVYVTVLVKAARGLPADKSTGTYVKFQLYLDDEKATDKSTRKAMNPKINWRHTFSFVVTDELCNYVATDSIDFEVWGRTHLESIRPASVLDRPASQMAGAGASSVASTTGSMAMDAATEAHLASIKKEVAEQERQRAAEQMEGERKEAEAEKARVQAELKAAQAKVAAAEEQAKAAAAEAEKLRAEHAAAAAKAKTDDVNHTPQSADSQDPVRMAAVEKDNEALKKRLADMEAQLASTNNKSKACSIL